MVTYPSYVPLGLFLRNSDTSGATLPKQTMQGMTCKESSFEMINSCKLLRDNFPCDKCAESYGPDQPSYVELDAPEFNVRI